MRRINYYKYGQAEINHLKKADPLLGEAIDKIGMVKREVKPSIFPALISSIISQQISMKAAVTVENRLVDLLGELRPENIYNTPIEDIQKCGMSMRKAEYIKGIGELAHEKTVDFDNLDNLSDENFIKELTKIRGVGIWTAEMLLIHSLQRGDILSFKDLGIRRGMERLYGIEEIAKEDFNKYKKIYSPYATVASIYLWEISSENYKEV